MTHLEEPCSILSSIVSQFPSQAGAESLVNIFFSVGQANYYILHEPWFWPKLSEIYHKNSFIHTDYQFIGLALMTFAIASQYTGNRSNNRTIVPGMKYFQDAQRLLPQILAEPCLESVQTCLMMASYLLPIRGAGPSYIYIRLAMQMAVAQGLHKANSGHEISSAVREIHSRVFWSTYINERRITGDLGYKGVIQISEIECPPPQKCSELDEGKTSQIDRFIAFRELSLLFDEALQLRKYGNTSVDFRNACSRLRGWNRSLHSNVQRLVNWSLRANADLQIHYHLCWTYLGRVDLIRIIQDYLNNRRAGLHMENDEPNGPSVTLATLCVDSAYKIINLINLLLQEHQLAKFSHTDFHSCSSATTIILLDSIIHPSSEGGLKVATGMQALRFMAAENSKALKSLKYIEGLVQEINEVLAYLYGRTTPSEYHAIHSPDQSSRGSPLGADAQHQVPVQLDAYYDSDQSQEMTLVDNSKCTVGGPNPENSIFSTIDAILDTWALDISSYSGLNF
ncbi:fungal-specific transcription factor domain-containing protein [Mariannaea sp. PMI_226]|nr:fungal-specific transcription factor domain-containing protein [Mariannaea sp. PMI_226]